MSVNCLERGKLNNVFQFANIAGIVVLFKKAQRFASRPVLVDSFESGDLSAWSSSVE